MKHKQGILAGVLAAVVLLGAAFFLLTAYNRAQEQAQAQAQEDAVVHILTMDEVDAITYTYQGNEQTLTLAEDSWQLQGDEKFTINQSVAQAMAQLLADFTANRSLERDEQTDYGFDDPAMTVTAQAGDVTATLIWGDENSVTGDYYLQLAGQEDTVYTVDASSLQKFQYSYQELYRGITLLDLAREDAKTFSVETGEEQFTFTSAESDEENELDPVTEQESGQVSYTWQLSDGSAVDADAVDAAFSAVCGQTTQWAVTHVEDAAVYGMDESAARVCITTEDGTYELLISEAEDGQGNRYVMEPGSDVIYTLSAAALESFSPRLEDYLA